MFYNKKVKWVSGISFYLGQLMEILQPKYKILNNTRTGKTRIITYKSYRDDVILNGIHIIT